MRRASCVLSMALVVSCGADHAATQGEWEPLPSNEAMQNGLHGAAWTGSELLVWGGTTCDPPCPEGQGGVLKPSSGGWRQMNPVGEPVARYNFSSAWSGTELLVWGGIAFDTVGPTATGALYDPSKDQWRTVATTDAPSARMLASAVWSGTEALIWGGMTFSSANKVRTSPNRDLSDGGAFDPVGGQWRALPANNAPSGRKYHSAVWAKTRMIVWGGNEGDPPNDRGLSDGAVYDPSSNTWTGLSKKGAPSPRWAHLAVWTGTEMIIWGGRGCGDVDSGNVCRNGAAYNPSTDSWRPLPPGPSDGISGGQQSAVWTGKYVILWGTRDGRGWLYEPSGNRWVAMTAPPPGLAPRSNFSTVWTGERMLLWGGLSGDPPHPLSDGAAFIP
jgi:hypothetical protein